MGNEGSEGKIPDDEIDPYLVGDPYAVPAEADGDGIDPDLYRRESRKADAASDGAKDTGPVHIKEVIDQVMRTINR